MIETAIKKRVLSPEKINELNEKYKSLSVKERITALYKDFDVAEVMLTSSFAATSAFLLHAFSAVNKAQKIYFIDTGYHFTETLNYKEMLTELYGLQVESVTADAYEHNFTQKDKTWTKNPDFCCSINKVKPLDLIKELNIFEQRNSILKFYPLLDVTEEERKAYIKKNHLPFHPLVAKGYSSIGCKHCTVPGKGRAGRWNNSPKTECGLHL